MIHRSILVAGLLILPCAALAQQGIINPQTNQSALIINKGQLPGTITNDSASSGNAGEYQTITESGVGSATVTFTNGSANIGWTQAFSVGNVVSFTTSGSLPTNFVVGTNYYVIATGLSGSNIQVSATPGGSAIVAGSAGSGTQTGLAGVVLGTGNPQDVVYLALTAGDWDVQGTVFFRPAASTSVTLSIASVGSSSNSNPGITSGQSNQLSTAAQVPAQSYTILSTIFRFSLSGTTNVYLDADAAFSVSTMSAGGFLRARRVR